jgi:hypothetical protein
VKAIKDYRRNLTVEIRAVSFEYKSVKVAAAKSQKTEAELLDHATNNLLRGLKRDMQKKDGRVNYDKLRKDGYSERLLAKLERA